MRSIQPSNPFKLMSFPDHMLSNGRRLERSPRSMFCHVWIYVNAVRPFYIFMKLEAVNSLPRIRRNLNECRSPVGIYWRTRYQNYVRCFFGSRGWCWSRGGPVDIPVNRVFEVIGGLDPGDDLKLFQAAGGFSYIGNMYVLWISRDVVRNSVSGKTLRQIPALLSSVAWTSPVRFARTVSAVSVHCIKDSLRTTKAVLSISAHDNRGGTLLKSTFPIVGITFDFESIAICCESRKTVVFPGYYLHLCL